MLTFSDRPATVNLIIGRAVSSWVAGFRKVDKKAEADLLARAQRAMPRSTGAVMLVGCEQGYDAGCAEVARSLLRRKQNSCSVLSGPSYQH